MVAGQMQLRNSYLIHSRRKKCAGAVGGKLESFFAQRIRGVPLSGVSGEQMSQ